MRLVDTHVHLYFEDFNADQSEVIERARSGGVHRFVNVGVDAKTSALSLALAEKHEDMFATAGIHPHDTKDADDKSLKEIEAFLSHPKMLAIGEIGLDFYRDHSPHDVQEKILSAFLDMYRRVRKPLVIHCRDAYDRLLEIFKAEKLAPYNGIMHCFSSDREHMQRFLDLGFCISFAGPLTYKKNDVLRDACRACPKDRLLLETDAPFLPPQSRRGKRNESAYIIETAALAAQLHSVSVEEIGEQTTQNAYSVLGLC